MVRSQTVSSPANPLLRSIRKALMHGTLTGQGYCVAETFHLLEEALRSNCSVPAVLAADSARSAIDRHIRRLSGARIVVLADRLFQSISGTESSQGVIALVVPPVWKIEQLFQGNSLVIVLDRVQDPGNAGTIVRAAEAFGASGVIFTRGTVSPFNPKTIRAAAGSLFRIPFVHAIDPGLGRAALQQNQLDIYAGVPHRSNGKTMLLDHADLTRKCALVVGSEGHGVGEEFRSVAVDLAIPTVGVESLNTAMAAAILLYEARRQRGYA